MNGKNNVGVNLDEMARQIGYLTPQSGVIEFGTQFICTELNCNERLLNLDDCKENWDHIQNHGRSFVKVAKFQEILREKKVNTSATFDKDLNALKAIQEKLESILYDYKSIVNENHQEFLNYFKSEEEKWKSMISNIFSSIRSGFQKVFSLKLEEQYNKTTQLYMYSKSQTDLYNGGYLKDQSLILKQKPFDKSSFIKKQNMIIPNLESKSEFNVQNSQNNLEPIRRIKPKEMFSRYNLEGIKGYLDIQRNISGDSLGQWATNQSQSIFLDSKFEKDFQKLESQLENFKLDPEISNLVSIEMNTSLDRSSHKKPRTNNSIFDDSSRTPTRLKKSAGFFVENDYKDNNKLSVSQNHKKLPSMNEDRDGYYQSFKNEYDKNISMIQPEDTFNYTYNNSPIRSITGMIKQGRGDEAFDCSILKKNNIFPEDSPSRKSQSRNNETFASKRNPILGSEDNSHQNSFMNNIQKYVNKISMPFALPNIEFFDETKVKRPKLFGHGGNEEVMKQTNTEDKATIGLLNFNN